MRSRLEKVFLYLKITSKRFRHLLVIPLISFLLSFYILNQCGVILNADSSFSFGTILNNALCDWLVSDEFHHIIQCRVFGFFPKGVRKTTKVGSQCSTFIFNKHTTRRFLSIEDTSSLIYTKTAKKHITHNHGLFTRVNMELHWLNYASLMVLA